MSNYYPEEKIDSRDIEAAIRMVNDNHDMRVREEQRRALAEEVRRQIGEENFRQDGYGFDTPEGRSIGHSRRSYRNKKKNNPNAVRNAIYVVALSISLVTGAVLDNVVVNATNVVVPKTISNRFEVDDRIDYYKQWMGMNSESQHKVEICYGHDHNGEAIVDYSPENLAYHIINASSKSESEVRSVIIAAYDIINAPYREDILGSTFRELAQKVQEDPSISLDDYLTTGSADGFLASLGYEDWDDYKMNERSNIRDLRAIENYMSKGVSK